MRIIALFIYLAATTGSAHAFFSLPRTDPAQPLQGQPFDVLIDVGGCHGFTPPLAGQAGPRVEVDGQTVRIFEPGVIFLNCNLPNYTLRRTAPPLQAGEYRLEVHIIRAPPLSEVFLSTAAVTVAGAQSTIATVPALSIAGLLVAVLLVLALAKFKQIALFGAFFMFGSFFAVPDTAHAQDRPPDQKRIYALVRAESGITVQMIVQSTAFGAGQPGMITPGLGEQSPRDANYLLPFRATGDFQAFIRQNPSHPRSKLERYISIDYPDTANLDAAISALRADATFEYAYVPPISSFHSRTTPKSPQTILTSQPWRTLLGLDAAHAITGGWSTVGIVDNGIEISHAALSPFSTNGMFQGGNFLPNFSLHIALRAPPQ